MIISVLGCPDEQVGPPTINWAEFSEKTGTGNTHHQKQPPGIPYLIKVISSVIKKRAVRKLKLSPQLRQNICNLYTLEETFIQNTERMAVH